MASTFAAEQSETGRRYQLYDRPIFFATEQLLDYTALLYLGDEDEIESAYKPYERRIMGSSNILCRRLAVHWTSCSLR